MGGLMAINSYTDYQELVYDVYTFKISGSVLKVMDRCLFQLKMLFLPTSRCGLSQALG